MDPQELSNNHSHLFKYSSKNFDSIRRDHQAKTIELRKNRREELIQKKRNIDAPVPSRRAAPIITNLNDALSLLEKCTNTNPDIYIPAVLDLRLFLSNDKIMFIDELLNHNIVDILISLISTDHPGNVRYNAAWALTNIASGSSQQTSYLLKEHVIMALGNALYDQNPLIVEQAIWTLSNIMGLLLFKTIGDGPKARAFVLSSNLLSILGIVVTNHGQNISVMKQFSWMLINVCRKKNAEVPLEYVSQIIPILLFLLDSNDEAIASDALWSVTHLADSSQQHISLMIQGGLIDKVFRFFSGSTKLAISALRASGNVAASVDEHTQYLLDKGILQHLKSIFSSPNSKIRKEVYWLLSNIAAGTRAQMTTLFSLNIFPQLIRDLDAGEYQVQREACWVISNVLHSSTIHEAQAFVDRNVLFLMKKFLSSQDTPMIIVVLEVLLILLRLYLSHNQQQYICNLIEDIEKSLQSYSNKTVNTFASNIIEKFFSYEEEVKDDEVESMETDTFSLPDSSSKPHNSEPYNF